jgi:uncharacterized protein
MSDQLLSAKDFIDHSYRYAVIGATTNHEKYGYRVLMDLNDGGYQVVGVNPKYQEINGIKVYPTIAAVPTKPHVVVSVVPPAVGRKIVDEVAAEGIKKMWFQPGAESKEIRERCQEKGISVMANGSCIMVDRQKFVEPDTHTVDSGLDTF